MNILFVCPSNAIGGAEISLLEMAKYLHSQEYGVFIIIPYSKDKRYINLIQPYTKQIIFIPLIPWNCIKKNNKIFFIIAWLKRFIKSKGAYFYSIPLIIYYLIKYKIDIVHTNNIMALDGAIASRILGIPHVQHLRELTGFQKESIFPMVTQKWPKVFSLLLNKLNTIIIANSIYTQKHYDQYNINSKTKVLYNSIDLPENISIDPNIKFIGLVANVTSKVKNHLLFIRIASKLHAKLPHLRYYIFGRLPTSDDEYFKELINEIEILNLKEIVIFKGVYHNINQMYSEIDILIHTYPFETFGRVFIEAMSYGIPVVSVEGGGANELIKSGENGFLFNENDQEQAVKVVSKICADPLLFNTIVINALNYSKKFSIQKKGIELINIYKSIVKT
jgi:glycosyltransferase involved in cell wall biosynthesis